MISQNDNEVALSVLRKYDPQSQIILDSCYRVKLYNYDKSKNIWIIQNESEGVFYFVKRNAPPLYKFVILSKYNKPGTTLSTTEIPISQHLMSQIHQTFYMFKNELGIIQALLFPKKSECDRIFEKVEKIVRELKIESEKMITFDGANCRPRMVDRIENRLSNKITPESPSEGSEKILSMLEAARQRYEESHVEKWSRQIDIKELFSSTTGANHIGHSSPSCLIDSVASQNQVPLLTTNLFKDPDIFQADRDKMILPQTPNRTERSPSISSKNGPNTLTVTELEKILVENARTTDDQPKSATTFYDDDLMLLTPNKLAEQQSSPPLNKEQLKQALIFMLQNDENDSFVTQLHTAYLQSLKRANNRK